jgi:hypothetical protein
MGYALWQCEEELVVCVCCVCGQARDDIAKDASWGSLKEYLDRCACREKDIRYSHTFCPCCFMHYRQLFGLEPSASSRRAGML